MLDITAFRHALDLRLTDQGLAPQQVRRIIEDAVDCLPAEQRAGDDWVPTHCHNNGQLYRVLCRGMDVNSRIGHEVVIYDNYAQQVFVQATTRFFSAATDRIDCRTQRFVPVGDLTEEQLRVAWAATRASMESTGPAASVWPTEYEAVVHNFSEPSAVTEDQPLGTIQVFAHNRLRFVSADGSISIAVKAPPAEQESLDEALARFSQLIAAAMRK